MFYTRPSGSQWTTKSLPSTHSGRHSLVRVNWYGPSLLDLDNLVVETSLGERWLQIIISIRRSWSSGAVETLTTRLGTPTHTCSDPSDDTTTFGSFINLVWFSSCDDDDVRIEIPTTFGVSNTFAFILWSHRRLILSTTESMAPAFPIQANWLPDYKTECATRFDIIVNKRKEIDPSTDIIIATTAICSR